VLNTVPWGGSTARASAALNVSPIDIFVPMIPAIASGIIAVLVLAYFLGRRERKRVGLLTLDDQVAMHDDAAGSVTVKKESEQLVGAASGASSIRRSRRRITQARGWVATTRYRISLSCRPTPRITYTGPRHARSWCG
jgi:CitMHS family citrate-Mg2+:H+ or citrate-Ca2+:H+ symporter